MQATQGETARRSLVVSVLFCAGLFAASLCALASTNPVPLINQPLVPETVAPGGPGFTLTVNGTGFIQGSVVNWNGSPISTTFVASSQLAAAIPATDIAIASTAFVTVVNPGPGGGASNTGYLQIASPVAPPLFSATDYPTTQIPFRVFTADFNGDGKLDLITVFSAEDSFSVQLGNGDGTFQAPVSYATSATPLFVAVRDLNGDGKLDLAVVNANSNTVSIFLGKGDGTFQPKSDYATGAGPLYAAVGDFNGDGKLDLAIPNSNDSTLSILLGNGDGTFQVQSVYAVGLTPTWAAEGDFNGDGILDLAVTNQDEDTVSLLFGNGDGTFQPQVKYDGGSEPQSVAAADLNGDGILDLAVQSYFGSVTILLGRGDGEFLPGVEYPTGSFDSVVAAADFNGDGKLDLLNSGGIISILLGNGDGSFQAPITEGGSNAATIGDFNRDGMADLATANEGPETIAILLQTASPAVSVSPGSVIFPVELGGSLSPPQAVTLTDTGNGALTISSIVATGDFVQHNSCGTSVAAGQSCTITVVFKPTGKGTLTGAVTITDNAAGSPQTVPLTGTGTLVKLSTTSLSFSGQPVGTTSNPQTVTVTNISPKAPVTIQGIRLSGANPFAFGQTNNCGASIAPGASCTISLTFSPKTKGAKAATLNIGDNGGGSPQTVALSGTGA